MGANKEYRQKVTVGGEDYEVVAAGATAQVLGTTGSIHDFLGRLIVNVTTSATSQVSIKDGAGADVILVPPNAPIGAFTLELGLLSSAGAWAVTTAAGVSVVAVGKFST